MRRLENRSRSAFLLGLCFASGCAALIYELVWFHLLELVIGASAISLAVLLGTFMGGMGLGSLLAPRWVARGRHPLRVYAVLEMIIAISGVAIAALMPAMQHIYISALGHVLPSAAARALVCVICLLPPTICFGATLPVAARWAAENSRGIGWLGYFYGCNTLGAVGGCVLSGFFLLRLYDVKVATVVAVALNLVAAAGAWFLARGEINNVREREPRLAGDRQPYLEQWAGVSVVPGRVERISLYFVLSCSGAAALGAEVIWTRLLALILGGTVYTFSIILAVFLAGLGFGGALGGFLATRVRDVRWAVGVLQFFLVLAVTWAAWSIARQLPYWHVRVAAEVPALTKFGWDIARVTWAVFPAALLWGASFPLTLAAVAGDRGESTRTIGRASAANTFGAILGAVGTAMWVIPAFGTQRAQQLVGLVAMLAALAALLFLDKKFLWVLLGATLSVVALVRVPPVPWQLVAYGREILWPEQADRALFVGEGRNSSVAVSVTDDDGARFFHTSGKTEASSLPKDMRLQHMLADLPALLHPHPQSVLIVGCGAGVTAGAFVPYASFTRIVICEIEPLIPQHVATLFAAENHHVLSDLRLTIVYDDARHFLATTREKFDIITSDPIHPWVKGAATLYTEEYIRGCREHLNPGGIVTQWVPFYESSRAAVQSELATFFAVFPDGTVWGNDDEGKGYDTVMLGRVDPLRIDGEALQAAMMSPRFSPVKASLHEVDLDSAYALLKTYAGRGPELREWLREAQLNRDRSLRLQYLAGQQLNSAEGIATYAELLQRRTFPTDIFPGKTVRNYVLEEAWEKTKADAARK